MPRDQIRSIDYMAQQMFFYRGLSVDLFYGQDLELYMVMQNAGDSEEIVFIDEL